MSTHLSSEVISDLQLLCFPECKAMGGAKGIDFLKTVLEMVFKVSLLEVKDVFL